MVRDNANAMPVDSNVSSFGVADSCCIAGGVVEGVGGVSGSGDG